MSTGCVAPQMTVSKADAEAEKQARNKAGLDAVLASLQAAKKANVLDKSRSDWTDFKQSDTQVAACGSVAGLLWRLSSAMSEIADFLPVQPIMHQINLAQVEEELQMYKKSGDKYLDKVDFLKRTELKEYEKERDARLGGDVRSRGRL
jgi:hypothetical protein